MAYPLSFPVATYTGSPTAVITPNFPIVKLGNPPIRTTNFSLGGHSRTVAKVIIIKPNFPTVRIGNPPVRSWSVNVVLESFPTTLTYGQWWPRSSRDRP